MKPIKEFLALGPKSYSFIVDKDDNKKHIKCKGVSKSVVKKHIDHNDYNNCITTGKQKNSIQATIRAFKHQVYTTIFNKVSLSAFDDKVYRTSHNEGYVYGYSTI